jgi:hypothetical protein
MSFLLLPRVSRAGGGTLNKLSYRETILGWKLGRASCVRGEDTVAMLKVFGDVLGV